MQKKRMWKATQNSNLEAGLLTLNVPVFTSIEEKGEFVSFPYSIILTQACDIESYYRTINEVSYKHDDEKKDNVIGRQIIKQLIFSPAFDEEKFKGGLHIKDQYGYKLESLTSGEVKSIKEEKRERYQYIKSNVEDIPNLFVDFKHYFTAPIEIVIESVKKQEIFFKLDHIHYTKLSDRFAHYVQRVAIP